MTHPTRTLAAVTGAALTGALTIAAMPAASAAVWTHEDAVADVEYYSWDERTGKETGPVTDPANTDTDITHVSADHKARRLVLGAGLRDITVDSGMAVYRLKTSKRNYHVVQRLGTDREMGPRFALYRGDGHRVRCSGARHSVDRTTEQATVNLPRGCIGRPSWVRVGAAAMSYAETRTTFTYRFDDAVRDGAGNMENFTLGPRIQRG